MIGYTTLKGLFDCLLSSHIVSRIYHSVQRVEKDGLIRPAYRNFDSFIYVGVDDTKVMNCYIRQLGAMTVRKTEFISSCAKAYTMNVAYRLVFFNDYEQRNFDLLTTGILQCIFLPHINLVSFYENSNEVLVLETSPERFTLGASSFYKAMDINVSFILESSTCETEINCERLGNPIC